MSIGRLAAAFLIAFAANGALLATEVSRLSAVQRAADVPSDEVLVAEGATIGAIEVITLDVFDPNEPKENLWPYRLANRLHVETRPSVVRRRLTLETGDVYDPRELLEAARILRGLPSIYEAKIVPVRYHDGVVDLRVVTRDVWTLGVGVGFSREGGENSQSFEINEANLLGFGKELELKYEDEPDRTSYRVRYFDDGFLGSRHQLRLLGSDNSDGHRYTLDFERPFYELADRRSWGFRAVDDERRVRLYAAGREQDRFFRDASFLELRGGLSSGLRDGWVRRLSAGVVVDEAAYRRERPVISQSIAKPFFERNLAYPWVELGVVQDGWVPAANLDRIVRTEDVNLGLEAHVRVGYSTTALGADRDRWVADLGVSRGFRPSSRFLVLLGATANGWTGEDGWENALASVRLRAYWRNFGRHNFVVAFDGQLGRDLDPERQLFLGGDTGLRGYPRRFQAGDRRWVLTLEQRFYSSIEVFRLFHLGAAVFADVGRAWYEDGNPYRDAPDEVLRDVGMGLRFASSRSSRGVMIHLDVAFPLDGDLDSVQWIVRSSDSF